MMYVYGVRTSCVVGLCVFFFKQKTAYEMRISDWSSDVCSSDLATVGAGHREPPGGKLDVALRGFQHLGSDRLALLDHAVIGLEDGATLGIQRAGTAGADRKSVV